jgi:hypothetical protein
MIKVTGLKPLTENPKYDTSHFVNEGPFFDKHPDVIKNIIRFEATDISGNIVESWERDKNGVMVETTKRDKLREELVKAQEELQRIKDKEANANDNT